MSSNLSITTEEIKNQADSDPSTSESMVVSTSKQILGLTLGTSLGRKLTYTGLMYLAGGAIVSTVGLTPVIITTCLIYYT